MPALRTVKQKPIFLKLTEHLYMVNDTKTRGNELSSKCELSNDPPSLCAAIHLTTNFSFGGGDQLSVDK